MTHRDDLAAVCEPFRVFTASDGHPGIATRDAGDIADAVIAYYRNNPTALLDLIRECVAAARLEADLRARGEL